MQRYPILWHSGATATIAEGERVLVGYSKNKNAALLPPPSGIRRTASSFIYRGGCGRFVLTRAWKPWFRESQMPPQTGVSVTGEGVERVKTRTHLAQIYNLLKS
jgi:hypothetical protein